MKIKNMFFILGRFQKYRKEKITFLPIATYFLNI